MAEDLERIIEVSREDCMQPIFQDAKERIETYFWDTIDYIQDDVLGSMKDPPKLRENEEIKAILSRMLRDYDDVENRYYGVLREQHRAAYLKVHKVVTAILSTDN